MLSKKTLWLFFIIFSHITLLDLFFVTYDGPVFLFDENLTIKTITTHLIIALSTVLSYFVISRLRHAYKAGKLILRDEILILCCVALVIAIMLVLF